MSQPSWIGYTLGGRYLIEEMLGQGGMSSVYRATDPNLRRTVAVKLIHPHLSGNPEFVRRFEEEAAAVAQLRHPNIIQVFDFNHDGDTYYMVLEYVPGETLQERLRSLGGSGQRMKAADVARVGAGLADAVDYAHKRGMIHRDIKPANVMLNPQGQAILMDFGIAKMIGGTQHTATGAVVGTALYMSPEQALGKRPTSQSDIYSLGVTLFEMVGGRPPFEGDSTMTVMTMHVNDPVPDINTLNPDTPPSLKRIIESALVKDPERRTETAAEIAGALRELDPATASTRRSDSRPEATFIEASAPSPESTYVESSQPEPPRWTERVEATPPAPPPIAPPKPREKRGGPSIALIGGGIGAVILLAICAVVGIFVIRPMLTSPTPGGETPAAFGGDTPATAEPATEQVVIAAPTDTSPAATEVIPTDVPAPTEVPTATDPPGPFARINGITLDGNVYVVDYETFGYTEQLPGMHVHFYFDTVTQTNAGSPGSGPWYLYGGPRPFRGYTTGDRPGAATQMCALVANADHSIILDSGNCVSLP